MKSTKLGIRTMFPLIFLIIMPFTPAYPLSSGDVCDHTAKCLSRDLPNPNAPIPGSPRCLKWAATSCNNCPGSSKPVGNKMICN